MWEGKDIEWLVFERSRYNVQLAVNTVKFTFFFGLKGDREISWKVKALVSWNMEAFVLPPSSEITVNSNLFHLSYIYIMQVFHK